MRSATGVESAVFHLTPTRTRCELFVVYDDGNKVKIASGLVNPFLTHLKAAKDQMSKGGYSIVIKPDFENEAFWFTRGTIERFVRFVSTPEVLERVYSLELEMIQIDETIALQNNNDADDASVKPKALKLAESKQLSDQTDEKALILYEGEEDSTLSNEAIDEENSKAQLLKVLENRKVMLQKEQGMAFARAAAAGFDMEHMSHLMHFSDSFGAQRLKDASIKFMELWKRKHETGQWVEIDASEVMATRPDFSAVNASGIILENGKPNNDYDGRPDMAPDPQYYHGQYAPPMYPPWPMHSSQGVFPGSYPLQGASYYPYFNPHFPQQPRRRRHSMDDDMDDDDAETWVKGRSHDDAEWLESNEHRRRESRSGKKKSSAPIKVSESTSGSGYEEDGTRSYEEALPAVTKEKSGGQWDAFQNFLLKDAEESESRSKRDMFTGEIESTGKKTDVIGVDDPLCRNGKMMQDDSVGGKLDFNSETYGSTGKVRDSDEFILHAKSKQDYGVVSDPFVMNRSGRDAGKGSSQTFDDNSIVALRQGGLDHGGSVQNFARSMESEFTSEVLKPSDQPIYEPSELSLMPKRTVEKETAGYDPALDFAVQVSSVDESETVEAVSVAESNIPTPEPVQPKLNAKLGEKKKITMPAVKGRSPLDDAKSRADKMRSYKADLLLLKKENENEQIKRLEALKLERQKRIALRSGSDPSSNSMKSPLPTARKFSDSSPGLSSPLQRTVRKSQSTASSVSRSDSGNRLIRSVSASPATGSSSERKASVGNLRRLSEPKIAVRNPVVAVKVVKRSESAPKFKPESAPKFKPESAPNIKSESAPNIKSESAPNIKSESALKLKSESAPKLKSESAPTLKSESAPNLKSESAPNFESESAPNLKSESAPKLKSESAPKLGLESVPKVETGSAAKVETGSAAKVETGSTPKLKTESGPKHKTELVPKLRTEGAPKITGSNGSESKRISAILNYDKNKGASLPELKISPKPIIPEPLGVSRNKKESSTGKNNSPAVEESHHLPAKARGEAISENAVTVVEKSLVVFEVHESPKKANEETVSAIGSTSNRHPVLPAAGEPISVVELSSNPAAANVAPSLEIDSTTLAPVSAQIAAFESSQKPQSNGFQSLPPTAEKQKESSTVFKKLLKFGRKGHNSDHLTEPDNKSASGSEPEDVSGQATEVYTLKNLISQEEATSNKSSRHFSLLSPFRSRSSEKKQTA